MTNSHLASHIPKQDYVQLHVSFIITNASHPSPLYFNLAPSTKMPTSIFSTFDTPPTSNTSSFPAFNSLNYLRALPESIGTKFGEGQWHVVKMFSEHKLDKDLLAEVYGAGNVGKVWEKVFLAYPKLDPIVKEEGSLARVRVDEGVYYVNGFERLISTMETETVASWNSVGLLLKDFKGYQAPTSWAEWDE